MATKHIIQVYFINNNNANKMIVNDNVFVCILYNIKKWDKVGFWAIFVDDFHQR